MSLPLLVGSRAAAFWGVGVKADPLSDWDLICLEKDRYIYNDFEKIDMSFETELDNEYVLHVFDSGFNTTTPFGEVRVCSLDGLAYLKRSHLARDYKWKRHITHYHFTDLVKYKNSFDMGKCLERQKLTLKKHSQPNPNLNQSNDSFFDDAVKKEFDHDWIHELVAFEKQPMYTRLKKREQFDKAWCQKDLWEGLTYEQKFKCVAEEAHVIASERFLIPTDWEHSWWGAYMESVKKICTTLCSGWFRDFAIDNYPEVVNKYDTSKLRLVKEMTK